MRVLVTGCAGFIGSNLIKRLEADGHQTVGVDDYQSADWHNLRGYGGQLITADVAGQPQLLQHIEPCEVIFHEAAITDTTVMDQRRMMHNNLTGFHNILELAIHWKSRLIWASSASIYGQGPAPMKESQTPDPLNVYAFSKLAMENLAKQYQSKLKHPWVALRYFNVYGPGEDHKGKFSSMIHQLAKQMRAAKRPRIFYNGQQKRDFVCVEDVIQANLRAISAKTCGVYNVGSGGAYSFNEVVEHLNRVLKTDLPPEYFENPYSFTQDWTQADLSAIRKALGYEPHYPLEKGIDLYYRSGLLGM